MWGNMATSMSKPLYLMFMTELGQYYDGTRVSFRLQPTWNISKHFELGGSYNFDHVIITKRAVSMTNHIIGIKAPTCPIRIFQLTLTFNITQPFMV